MKRNHPMNRLAASVLRPEDHDHFVEQGYVVLKNAVSSEIIATAVGALESGQARSSGDSDAVASCITDRMLDAIGELFGAPYPFTRRRNGYDMPRPCQPDADWPVPVAHVDDSYPTLMPNGWAVGSFVFLTPVRSRGGAFIRFPGSPNRYRQYMSRACHGIKGAAQTIECSGPYREFLAAPGDALLFHHLFGHTGSTNITDPATRHALLSRWRPERRIVPGRAPFEEMTTIERANSCRYLKHRYGLDLSIPPDPEGAAASHALQNGVALWDTLQTYALLHFNGQAHLYHVDRSDASVIHRSVSDDFIIWRRVEPLVLDVGRIRSLHLHQYTLDVILGVTTDAGEGSAILFSSHDLQSWSLKSRIGGVASATPWYVYPEYPSKIAGGQSVYLVPKNNPGVVECRWGERWETAGDWSARSTAAYAPEQGRICDVTLAAYFSDSHAAMVADVGSEASSSPHFAMPKDIAVAEGALTPLPYACASPPRMIRIFNRAQHYWLTTYVRRRQGQERLFWGEIDWTESPVTLRELSSIEDFDRAKQIVGFV